MICEAAPALSSLPPHTHASSRLYRTSQWGGGHSKQRRHEHTPAPPADVLSPRQRRGVESRALVDVADSGTVYRSLATLGSRLSAVARPRAVGAGVADA